MNGQIMPMIIITILTIIEMVIYAKTLEWLFDLEKLGCKCSDDGRKDFIKIWIQIYIGVSIVMYFLNMYYLSKGTKIPESNILSMVKFTVGIFSLVNLILSIQYIQNLKDIDCKCSENVSREVYFIYNWIKIGFIILFFIVMCLAFVFALIYQQTGVKIKNNGSSKK